MMVSSKFFQLKEGSAGLNNYIKPTNKPTNKKNKKKLSLETIWEFIIMGSSFHLARGGEREELYTQHPHYMSRPKGLDFD